MNSDKNGTQEQQEPETERPAESAEVKTPEKPESDKPETFTFTREEVEKLEEAAKQLETFKEHFIRQSAEYDNYRKRTAREKEKLYTDAKSDTIKAFLPVYDDLERAVSVEGDEDSPHKKGLVMIFQKYKDILNTLNVTEIDALGKPFDPEEHNAVQHIEDPEKGDNEVAQVFQAGFKLGDKVIRHAVVVVAN